MSVTTEKTVGELALENPGATRVFEKLGIDYCCGGGQTLEQACQAAHVSIDQVVDSLAAVNQSRVRNAAQGRNWQAEPLSDLIAHIRSAHHKYTREEIARLGPLFDKVCSVHGKEPLRIGSPCARSSAASPGIDHAHDEGGDDAVPVH